MSKAQTLKSVVKKGVAEKPSFGTNPFDPWSAKANLAEDAALKQYLTSRGINPKYVTKNQMVAHSKMGQFLKWKRDHNVAEEEVEIDEGLQQKLRKLIPGYAKHQINKKMDAEKFGKRDVDRDVNYYRYKKVLDKANENVELDEVSTDGYHKAAIKSRMDAAVKVTSSMGSDKQAVTKLNARNKGLKRLGDRTSAEMKKANSGPQKQTTPSKPPTEAERRGYGQGRYMGDSVESNGEVISEISSETLQSYKNKAMKSSDDLASKGEYKKSNNRLLNHMKATGKQIDKTTAGIKKSLNKENTQDPMAASSMPNDGANSPDDVAPKNKNKKLIQMSKSARIIKNLYKKKGMKEDAYGKKPKMQQVSTDLDQPKAAAVLTGGTTLTGEKRDTIEIDPMMKMRKPISGKR